MIEARFEESWFDGSGYPSEEFLSFLEHKEWSVESCDFFEILLGVSENMPYASSCFEWKEIRGEAVPVFRFSSGGWSGNEYIINTIRHTLAWLLFWECEERGGHYYFNCKNCYDQIYLDEVE